ncbi:MAG: phosphatase PAP2 family protein [Paludibacter sp.]
MKIKVAKFISFIGHPLLTIPLFILVVLFSSGDLKNALLISTLLIGGVFLPLILRLYNKSKDGSYTNFDVSDRIQRKSMFVFVIPLLIIVTFVLFASKQSTNICLSVLFATLLIIVSQVVNLAIKSSLHVSLNIYLSFILITFNFEFGIILLLFTFVLGWSRLVLGRHSLKEVLFGGAIGLIISLLMIYFEGYLFL